MSILLDTHAFLWYLMADRRLSPTALQAMLNTANQLFLSAASLWEIGIKVGLGKLTLPGPFPGSVASKLQQMGTQILGITLDHVGTLASLPFHHKDPFDRMLASQAITEKLVLLSADPAFDAYGVTRQW